MEQWKTHVDRFCHQYIQLEPTLDYPKTTLLRESHVQEAIFTKLFADNAIQYGPPPRYKIKILKDLVSKIETSIDDWDEHEVSENLMTALSVLLATPMPPETTSVQQKCYVTYHLSSDNHITLLENRYLLSAGGTTGLRTWEAALHLGRYLCQKMDIVKGKRVLELGAGTGYLSILCADHLDAAHVIASDGSDDVINNLPDNLFLNNLQDSGLITAMDVKWGHALVGTEEEKWNGGRPVDVVIGADITYDHIVIPSLVATLMDLFDMWPAVAIYIAATQRNEDTFKVFLDVCTQQGLVVEDLEFEVPARCDQDGPFYSDNVAIRICKVSKSKT